MPQVVVTVFRNGFEAGLVPVLFLLQHLHVHSVLVPLVVHPREDQHVEYQQRAPNGNCHAQGGGVGGVPGSFQASQRVRGTVLVLERLVVEVARRHYVDARRHYGVHRGRGLQVGDAGVGATLEGELHGGVVVADPRQRVGTNGTVVQVGVVVIPEEVVPGDDVLHARPVQFRDQSKPHAQLVSPEVVLHARFHP